LLEGQHDGFQRLPFAAQLLGTLGVAPDVGVLDLRDNFLQPRFFALEVKDTS